MELGVGRRLSYRSARGLLVATGLIVLASTAAVLYARRVESTEVWAVLLFAPIYLAVVAGKLRGGVVAGVVASVVYAALRLHAATVYDRGQEIGLVASRTVAYLVFGLIGGFAVRQLEAALLKLDRYDLVDDDTGLFNARFVAQELELELARSGRYGSTFSVVVIDAPLLPLTRMRRTRRAQVLRSLGTAVSDAVRLVDRAAIAQDDDRFHVAVVMPETDAAGAAIVAGRLAVDVARVLDGGSPTASAAGSLESRALAFPEDQAALEDLRAHFVALDHSEHPVGSAA